MDIANPESVRAALEKHRPWAIVNAAGYVRVDEAERDHARCRRENAIGPQVLASMCRAHGARLVTFSSDLVFDGDGRDAPYVESDHVCPLSVYGASKVEAERQVLAAMPEALIVRTSAFFGPWDHHNFVSLAFRELSRGQRFRAAFDSIVSPTYVPDLVHATLDLLIDGQSGVWHLANRGAVSWAEFAVRSAELAGLACGLVEPCPSIALGFAAPRPPYSVLGSERAALMPPLEEALERYVRERSPDP